MQTDNDHSKWAWDTAPADGGPPRPVFIGNKEDWCLEETRKRRDTNREPWGGVWTEPLTPGATKAKWGKITFDSGRMRCCHDMHDCGLFVAVKQGPVNAWHFQRQWSWGIPRTYQYKCKNEAMYVGTSRFHHIVVNEIYSMLCLSNEFGGKDIESITKEQSVADLGNFKPDVYVKFEDETWFAFEVILKSAPDRDKHEMFGKNLIEIILNDLDCLDNDREFSRWIQQGGVSELILAESTLEQRTQRWQARENKWRRKDEREFRKAFDNRMGICATQFGFTIDIQWDSVTELEDVERFYEQELFTRLNNAQQQANHLQMEIEAATRRHAEMELQRLEAVSEVFERNTPTAAADSTGLTIEQRKKRSSNVRKSKPRTKPKKTYKSQPISKKEYKKRICRLLKIVNNSDFPNKKRSYAKWELDNLKSQYGAQNSKNTRWKKFKAK
ncbi:hypothetical protein OAT73_01725 [Candidatus Poseidoniaceae archaeon]|nr:hypothetical protein [Candidatus Poseidoniaceae archaeon]